MSRLEDTLRCIVDAMPHGSSVTLPVDWLRVELGMATVPIQPCQSDARDLSVDEVADIVKRRPSTVRGWCSSGQISAYRLNGREWRITRTALDTFLDGQRAPHDGEPTRTRRVAAPNIGAWRSVDLPGAA